jgi:hypothetical protein
MTSTIAGPETIRYEGAHASIELSRPAPGLVLAVFVGGAVRASTLAAGRDAHRARRRRVDGVRRRPRIPREG